MILAVSLQLPEYFAIFISNTSTLYTVHCTVYSNKSFKCKVHDLWTLGLDEIVFWKYCIVYTVYRLGQGCGICSSYRQDNMIPQISQDSQKTNKKVKLCLSLHNKYNIIYTVRYIVHMYKVDSTKKITRKFLFSLLPRPPKWAQVKNLTLSRTFWNTKF